MSTSNRLSLPALEPVYAAFLAAADQELPSMAGPLQAELWTSQQLGVVESAAPHAEGYRRALSDLVSYLREAATPGAVLFLTAAAAIGPTWLRRGAATAAAEASSGTAFGAGPEWLEDLGRVEAGDAWLLQDGGLGSEQVGVEFRYQGRPETHAILITFEHEHPVSALVIGDVAGMRERVAKAVEAEEAALLRLAPAVAGRRLTIAYDSDLPEALVPSAALIRQRLSVLTG